MCVDDRDEQFRWRDFSKTVTIEHSAEIIITIFMITKSEENPLDDISFGGEQDEQLNSLVELNPLPEVCKKKKGFCVLR